LVTLHKIVTRSIMVVHWVPRFLQLFLAPVGVLLSRPQLRVLRQLTLAWLMGGNGKMVRAARVTKGRHRTSLARFLRKSSWDAPTLLAQLVIQLLCRLQPRAGEWLYLLIDDTRIGKRGRHMPAVKKIWDHAEQRFVRGHIVITAAVVFRGLVLPWRFHLWLPKEYCARKHRKFLKMTAIAAEIVRRFTPPKGVKVRVLFDAFYLCPSLTAACENRGFSWFSVAARNRVLTQDGRPKRRLGDLGVGVLRHHGRRVRMRRVRGWRWLDLAAVDGRLKKIGTVRVVFSRRPRDRWKNMVAMVTNETQLPARDIVATYERRWAIEVLFKELKGTLGLGQYQMQHRQGIERHLHVCGLAHLALTHHSLKAVGAQAKQANKDVPWPRFQERLEALRRDVRKDNVERFVKRIRHAKTRRRVREHLLAE
jgi:SRSO17 transposase